ncbi:MAG: hypothetical protein PHO76_09285 [Methylotenera sp.]|jgi:hypothetical protein|nr:hypothetical protein [Methylotenera sp.]MDD4925954.1 hypothetical protein [Methylotenera sp.]
MAITMQQIEAFVKAKEISNYEMKDNDIVYGIKVNHSFKHHIRLDENGELFQMYARAMVDAETVNTSPHKALISSYLLKWGYDTKFCTTEMDSDGEIRLAVEIPLEDNTLTERQFSRIFGTLAEVADRMISEVNHILETGNLPVSNAAPVIDASMEPMLLVKALQEPQFALALLARDDVPETLKVKLRLLLATMEGATKAPSSF